jgi:hypothetical protein
VREKKREYEENYQTWNSGLIHWNQDSPMNKSRNPGERIDSHIEDAEPGTVLGVGILMRRREEPLNPCSERRITVIKMGVV